MNVIKKRFLIKHQHEKNHHHTRRRTKGYIIVYSNNLNKNKRNLNTFMV